MQAIVETWGDIERTREKERDIDRTEIEQKPTSSRPKNHHMAKADQDVGSDRLWRRTTRSDDQDQSSSGCRKPPREEQGWCVRTELGVVEEDGVALEDAAEGGRLDLAVASLVVQRKRVTQLHGKTGIVSTAW